jgi:starch-binding outer membrane protein SusE/F
MKKFQIGIIAITSLLFSSIACKKTENQIVLEDAKTPVLAASTAAVRLAPATETETAITLTWTNPEYKFTTGPNSLDVSYKMEMDTAGANFASASKYTTTFTSDLTKSYTEKAFNSILGNDMRLPTGRQLTMEVRITASIAGSIPKVSNVIRFTATAFIPPPKVAVPASGTLYITGSATPANWMGGGDPPNLAQKFTRIAGTNRFEIASLALSADNSFLLIPIYGDWSDKFGGIGGNNSNNVNGDDFKQNGSDLKAPGVAGNYKIVVDFQTGKYTLTKL